MIWIGTCGFAGRQPKVAHGLSALEIQETFYRPVSVTRAARWRSIAPPEFRFCVSASQFITHDTNSPSYRRAGREIPEPERSGYGSFQDSAPVREGWEATRAFAEALAASVIVFEAPESFGPTETNRTALYRFFESITTRSIKALDLRGPWATHIVERVCEDLNLVHAVDPFDKEPATYGLAYFRLRGSRPRQSRDRYSYSDQDLVRLTSICGEYDDAYVLFDNETKLRDARRFRELVVGAADFGSGVPK